MVCNNFANTSLAAYQARAYERIGPSCSPSCVDHSAPIVIDPPLNTRDSELG
jgi:hypothetical protein